MLWSILPVDIGPGCQLLVCGRQTVTQLPSHSHARLAKTAEVHFQSKYQHAVKGITSRNFFTRNCSSNWHPIHFHNQLLARDSSFYSSL